MQVSKVPCTIAVSYAWGDATPEGKRREAIVKRLCAAAEARGINIIRDRKVLKCGNILPEFTRRLGTSDRIFVVLSDKYLKSPNCMAELYEIWRNCRADPREFLRHIRVFTLPCAKIWTPFDRTLYAVYWRNEISQLDALVKKHGFQILGEKGARRYQLMNKFANEIGDILETVVEILQPRDFKEFEEYGFADGPTDGCAGQS